MSLNQFEELGYRIFKILHFHSPPLPYTFNADYSKMIMVTPKWKRIPYMFVILHFITFGLMSVFVTLDCLYWHKRKDFERVNAVVLSIMGLCALGFLTIVWKGFSFAHEIPSFCNEFTGAVDRLVAETAKYRRAKTYGEDFSISVLFLCVIIPGFSFMPYLFAIITAVTDIDTLYFFLDNFLPDPMYRDTSTTYIVAIVRIIYTYLGCQEFCRLGIVLFGLLWMLLDRITVVLPLLIDGLLTFDRFYFHYHCLLFAYKKIEKWFNLIMHIAFAGLFWGNVTCGWGVLKRSPADIDITLYAAFFIVFLGLSFGHLLLVPYICYKCDDLLHVVEVRKMRAKVIFAHKRTHANKVALKKAIAIMPIRVWYGSYWPLDREFVADYQKTLLDKFFDAVMTFD